MLCSCLIRPGSDIRSILSKYVAELPSWVLLLQDSWLSSLFLGLSAFGLQDPVVGFLSSPILVKLWLMTFSPL
jgi:hypothetical protein